MKERNIKYADDLLSQIAEGVKHLSPQTKLGCIEVVLYTTKDPILTTDLQTALGYIADDIYWNENGNWSLATEADVRTI